MSHILIKFVSHTCTCHILHSVLIIVNYTSIKKINIQWAMNDQLASLPNLSIKILAISFSSMKSYLPLALSVTNCWFYILSLSLSLSFTPKTSYDEFDCL